MAAIGPPTPEGPIHRRGRRSDGDDRRARFFGPPNPRWREEAAFASGLNIIVGLWLIVSPWVLGFADRDPVWSIVGAGAVISLLAFLRITIGLRAPALSWLNAALGVWTFASAFWLYDTRDGAWNTFIMGLVVSLLALWSAAASEARPHAFDRRNGRHRHHAA